MEDARGEARPSVRRSPRLRWGRRTSQLVALALWAALFVLARVPAAAALPHDLFLRIDPLAAVLAIGAARVVAAGMALSLIVVVATLLLGRAFCGWICPLGTLLDAAARLLAPPAERFSEATHERLLTLKYYLLAATVLAAVFSVQWAYLLDPLVLLSRGVAAGAYPALTAALPTAALPEPLRQGHHAVAFLPAALLLLVLALTAVTPRFWCRYLCPLGALLGLLSRAPALRRRVRGCDGCKAVGADRACVPRCRMGAVPSRQLLTRSHECIRCFSGHAQCHSGSIRFELVAPSRLERTDDALDLSKRRLLVAGASGLALSPVAALSAYHRGDPQRVVRPPRVADEDTFVDLCLRCALCVQACPTQTLQLTHLESGVAGLWTPALTPRVGGCVAGCDACARVCPSHAIPMFGAREADKWAVKMGTAVLEKNRCISYVDGLPCAKCLDACPTRAFVVEPKSDRRPLRPASVDYARCVGCGLCELACSRIVFGTPALLTFSRGRGEPTSLRAQPTEGYRVAEAKDG